jgi:hypothetical protein
MNDLSNVIICHKLNNLGLGIDLEVVVGGGPRISVDHGGVDNGICIVYNDIMVETI